MPSKASHKRPSASAPTPRFFRGCYILHIQKDDNLFRHISTTLEGQSNSILQCNTYITHALKLTPAAPLKLVVHQTKWRIVTPHLKILKIPDTKNFDRPHTPSKHAVRTRRRIANTHTSPLHPHATPHNFFLALLITTKSLDSRHEGTNILTKRKHRGRVTPSYHHRHQTNAPHRPSKTR